MKRVFRNSRRFLKKARVSLPLHSRTPKDVTQRFAAYSNSPLAFMSARTRASLSILLVHNLQSKVLCALDVQFSRSENWNIFNLNKGVN